MKRLLLIGTLLAATDAQPTATPSQHDFGNVAVMAFVSAPFRVTFPTGALARDTNFFSITGADAGDFAVMTGVPSDQVACLQSGTLSASTWRTGTCALHISFRPSSLGPKQAQAVIVDSRAGHATINLRGNGVAPLCTMTVVHCNYAHLYSGSFSWQSNLIGTHGSTQRTVTVTVMNGVATCSGRETETSISIVGAQRHVTSQSGTILGDGLIAVEFLGDSIGKQKFRITGACPSPAWPPSMNRPSQPAELGGDFYEQSYDQLVQAVGDDLVGSRSEPHPDTDNANGVSGTIVVTWHLKRS